jgi:hypothetical protein
MWRTISSLAVDALLQNKLLRLVYHGDVRTVEVHAVGFSTANNPVARVWQVSGGSSSGENVGWKLLRLDEVISAEILDQGSNAPRPGYNRNDRAFKIINAQF